MGKHVDKGRSGSRDYQGKHRARESEGYEGKHSADGVPAGNQDLSKRGRGNPKGERSSR